MRIAVLADIHANAQALQAVLEDSLTQAVERYWFLGDAVGYGPEPDISLLWLKRHVHMDDWVLGNHDAMLANVLSADEWARVNHRPRTAIQLNRETLAQHAEADRYWRGEFLRERIAPRVHSLDSADHVLVHGGQVDNFTRYVYPWELDFYIPAEFNVLCQQGREHSRPRVQWYGHTHVPALIYARPKSQGDGLEYDVVKVLPGTNYPLEAELMLVNPGSVGQPRDLCPRAAYAVLDTTARAVTFRRTPYEWQETAHLLRVRGYPDSLVARLRDAAPNERTPAEWLDHFHRVCEVEG
jgi:predicted phosphodiesterase